MWSFRDRGNWATHSGRFRGNWSPYVPRNIIMRYSKTNVYANLKLGQLAHRKLGQYQYN
jgi:hypothetical protein